MDNPKDDSNNNNNNNSSNLNNNCIIGDLAIRRLQQKAANVKKPSCISTSAAWKQAVVGM